MLGNGTLTLGGVNTYTGPTSVNSGTLNLTGTVRPPVTPPWAAAPATQCWISAGILTAIDFFAGNASGQWAQFIKPAEHLTLTAETGDDLCSAMPRAGLRLLLRHRGTLTTNGSLSVAKKTSARNPPWPPSRSSAGNGIMEINGATVNSSSGWVVMSRAGNTEAGILNIYSGTLTYGGGGVAADWGSGQIAVINVMGGTLSTTLNEPINLNWAQTNTDTGI